MFFVVLVTRLLVQIFSCYAPIATASKKIEITNVVITVRNIPKCDISRFPCLICVDLGLRAVFVSSMEHVGHKHSSLLAVRYGQHGKNLVKLCLYLGTIHTSVVSHFRSPLWWLVVFWLS